MAIVLALGAGAYAMRTSSFAAIRPADPKKASPQLRKMIDEYVARVESQPSSAEAHGDLGLVYAENGFYQEAIDCFNQADALDSGNSVWSFRRAMALRNVGDNAASAALLNSLAARSNAFPAIHYELGVARSGEGDLDAAELAFSKAAELSPNRAEPLVALADILNRKNRFEKARELSQRAMKMDPNYTAARYQLGLALRGLGKLDAAKRELQLGLGADQRSLPDPTSQRASELGISRGGRITRAVQLCDRGDLDGAERMLRSLADEYPDDVAVLNNLAAVLIQMKRHDDAMAILTDLVRIDDRTFGPYINLSFCSLQLGRYSDAIVYARDAVSRGSHVSQCHIALGDALSQAKDSDGALKAYTRAHELAPDNARLLLVMGRLCRDAGRVGEALEHLKKAANQEPDSFPAQASLCAVALEAGEIDTALRAFSRAEALGPDHPQTAKLRNRLQLAQRR